MKFRALFFLLMLFAFSYPSTYQCTGPVTGVSINPKTGEVVAENIGTLEWPKFCDVNNEINGVDPESCKIIFTALLTAQISGKSVTLWFEDDNDCSTHTPWQLLTGWYFGPKINN